MSTDELRDWFLRNETSLPQGRDSFVRTLVDDIVCNLRPSKHLYSSSEESDASGQVKRPKLTLKKGFQNNLECDSIGIMRTVTSLQTSSIPSFSAMFALAEDLSEAYSQGIKTGQTLVAPPANMSLSSNMSHNQPPLPRQPPSNQPDAAEARKPARTPFSTAKDRYEKEVGKLPETSMKKVESKTLSKDDKSKSENDGLPPELEHCDKTLVEKIEADIIHHGQPVTFDDIAGLEFAKECVVETICWPMTQPQLFQGLRSLPRGVLLFGPPGTGKTLIGKAIAHQSGATFFSISASSLMSKWIGEGEKTVRTLFAVAAYRQPSVVFIDEVDSLLSQRSVDENEATRRIKTEFMVQLDGANTDLNARVVVIGATNRPEELDEAVRRRFVKRLYIPLPDEHSRRALLKVLIKDTAHILRDENIEVLTQKTEGFSGADIRALCTEAAMGPIRDLAQKRKGNLQQIHSSEVPPITFDHFLLALEVVAPSVSPSDLQRYIDWNNTFGSYRRTS